VQWCLPRLSRLGLALSCLAVEIWCGCVLQSSFFLGQIRGLDEWLLNELLLTKDAANRLVVEELREFEKLGITAKTLDIRTSSKNSPFMPSSVSSSKKTLPTESTMSTLPFSATMRFFAP
jgi:hypothetical protein